MTTKTQKVVADICLYGTREVGAGWLASLADGGMLGNGEPKPGRSFTDALWLACDAIRRIHGMCGAPPVRNAAVRIFAPGGERMATMDLRHLVYFGDLEWTAAPVYEISAEDLMAAAEKD